MIKVEVITPECKPARATDGSSAWDLVANIEGEISIYPGQSMKIPTGIKIDLSKSNYAGILLPRSGLATRCNIVLKNLVGLIDRDYHKEVIAVLHNTGEDRFKVKPMMRICQLLFVQNCQEDDDISFVKSVEQNARGGFGSTGTTNPCFSEIEQLREIHVINTDDNYDVGLSD